MTTEGKVQNLDSEEQQLEAVRLLREYSNDNTGIMRRKDQLKNAEGQFTESEKQEIKDSITSYEQHKKEITEKIWQEYNVQTPRKLEIALNHLSVDFKDRKYDDIVEMSRTQQQQNPVQQSAQDTARLEYMEKSFQTIEARQKFVDKMKKLSELKERGEYYKQQEMEAEKAFEAMQQANFEMGQSEQRLMEVMGGRVLQNEDGKILHPDIQKAFGTDDVSTAHREVEQDYREQERKRKTPASMRQPGDTPKKRVEGPSREVSKRGQGKQGEPDYSRPDNGQQVGETLSPFDQAYQEPEHPTNHVASRGWGKQREHNYSRQGDKQPVPDIKP